MFLSRGELSREVDELMIKLRDTEKYGYNTYNVAVDVSLSWNKSERAAHFTFHATYVYMYIDQSTNHIFLKE